MPMTPASSLSSAASTRTADVARAWDLLDALTDPEIPVVTLRELGILRDVREGTAGLEVVITPTYSGCPAMTQMHDDVQAALAAAVKSLTIVGSDADPWSPDGVQETFGKHLGVEAIIIEGAQHFRADEGWGQWQGLLDWVNDPAADITVR